MCASRLQVTPIHDPVERQQGLPFLGWLNLTSLDSMWFLVWVWMCAKAKIYLLGTIRRSNVGHRMAWPLPHCDMKIGNLA